MLKQTSQDRGESKAYFEVSTHQIVDIFLSFNETNKRQTINPQNFQVFLIDL